MLEAYQLLRAIQGLEIFVQNIAAVECAFKTLHRLTGKENIYSRQLH
jgi:hypothetical protein